MTIERYRYGTNLLHKDCTNKIKGIQKLLVLKVLGHHNLF